MSVAGFDVGNDTACVAIARKRGIDVLLNKESKRETPTVVNFGEKMRFLGTDGSAKMGLSPQNTVHQLKRLLGKQFADPSVQEDVAKLPFAVSAAPDGGCLVTVQFQNETATFTPEQLMAMVLVDLKKISEAETGVPPVDCVLTVPVFFTEAQRYAMINAAQIAGLNCLRLMNENTATALAYGIFKTDLPETEPVHVAFVDVGHSATQVSIVSLRKSGLQVRCHAWDANLGGRDLDELLFNHFAEQYKQPPTKINIPSNKKASFKLRVGVEKLKKILSANAEAPLNIECIMDDKDIRGSLNREQLETLAEPMGLRLKTVLEKALAESGLAADQLSSVEVIGSSTRVPFIAKAVEQVFGKVPSRTLNAKECVSRGAALQCAMLSPVFKVREFDVVDAVPFAVDFSWEKDGKPTTQRVFERNSPFPAAKMLTFLRAKPFTITAVAPETGDKIGEYQIGPFTVPAGQETAKLKVKVRMNLHGLVQVENVQAVEEEEVAGAAAPAASSVADAKMEEDAAPGAANGEAPANGDHAGAAPMETDPAAAKPAGAAAEDPAKAKKAKVRKTEVPFTPLGTAGLSKKQLDDYFEAEGQMQAQDRLQEETADRKNAVEAYVYKLRNGISGGALEAYVKPGDKDQILSTLQACEDWLYEDGEDCAKSVYVAKLEEIRTLGGPVELRAHEDEVRPAAVSALQTAAEGYLNWCSSSDSRYAHITAEERAPLAAEAQAAINWLSEKVSLQGALNKYDPPVLLSADCRKKQEVLDRLAKPIVSKPMPKPAAPAAPPPPPASTTPTPEEGPAPMESEGASEGAPPPPAPEADMNA